VLVRYSCHHDPFLVVGALARLGCTRIGSPGIFGEQTCSTVLMSRML
jgi:hypothetical protein